MNTRGIEETISNLHELDNKVQKKLARQALRAGCKVELAAARAEAPELTGRTKRNIKIKSGGTKDGATRMRVGLSRKDYTGQAFYASFILYGHMVGSRKLGDARKKVPANNFLERAYDQTKEEAAEVSCQTFIDLIEAEASKA